MKGIRFFVKLACHVGKSLGKPELKSGNEKEKSIFPRKTV